MAAGTTTPIRPTTPAVARFGFDHGWLCLSATFLNLQLPVLVVDRRLLPDPARWGLNLSAAVTPGGHCRPPGSSSSIHPGAMIGIWDQHPGGPSRDLLGWHRATPTRDTQHAAWVRAGGASTRRRGDHRRHPPHPALLGRGLGQPHRPGPDSSMPPSEPCARPEPALHLVRACHGRRDRVSAAGPVRGRLWSWSASVNGSRPTAAGAGLSQVTLAGLVGRSESWLSQVERGRRDIDSLTVIRDLATALDVAPDALIGVNLPAPTLGAGHAATAAIRAYVDGYNQLLTPHKPQRDRRRTARRSRGPERLLPAARYDEALTRCPPLLAAVDALTHTQVGPAEVHAYVSMYVVAAKILHRVGESRLAALAADRAASMAARPGATGLDRGLAAREVVGALLYTGQAAAAEALAVDMATSLEADPDADSPDLLSLRGSLLLLAAVIAARRTDRHTALDRLDRADQLADRLGHDGNHAWTAFGPTNVAIHAVSVAAELGDAGEALRLSHQVDPADLPPGLVSRRAQLHLDLAWACSQHRRDAEAILQLLEAEHIAPQTHPLQPRRPRHHHRPPRPQPRHHRDPPRPRHPRRRAHLNPHPCPMTRTRPDIRSGPPPGGACCPRRHRGPPSPTDPSRLRPPSRRRLGGHHLPDGRRRGWIVNPPRQDYLRGRIRPDAVICCPATFNTLNKWAAGINDSPALGVLNDAIGLGTPTPRRTHGRRTPQPAPVWPATLAFLTTAGVDLLDPVTGQLTRTPSGIVSGTGDDIADDFDPHLLLRWLRRQPTSHAHE